MEYVVTIFILGLVVNLRVAKGSSWRRNRERKSWRGWRGRRWAVLWVSSQFTVGVFCAVPGV